MAGYIHIGGMIAELLEDAHRTKRDLGLDLGMSQGNVVYLCKRESIDVQMVHKIGNNLKYNFWKHYPIDDGKPDEAVKAREQELAVEKDKAVAELNAKIAELNGKVAECEKVIADLQQLLVKQENDFLKEINGLLRTSPKSSPKERT